MFSSDGSLGRGFAIATASLDGLAKRQQLHTENLANVDTVGYRAKQLDFESVLQGALKNDDPGLMYGNPFARDEPSGVHDAFTSADLTRRFTTSQSSRVGVDRASEVSGMMNDQVRFRMMSQQVTNAISGLRGVISEMGRS